MYIYSQLYGFIAENRELLRFFYSVVIAFICLIIVIKTDRLYRISSHQGIRYFRNAFFFYGIAFVLRYMLADYFSITKPFFEFFMIMGGFFLFYSLLWKRAERFKDVSSLFNYRILIFYILTIIIVVMDYLWAGHNFYGYSLGAYNFMFFSQIILFAFASIISYRNYQKNGKRHKFLKLYFVIMILSFLAWTFNFIFASFLGWHLRWLANIYILNTIVFLVFLYGVIKTTKWQRKEKG